MGQTAEARAEKRRLRREKVNRRIWEIDVLRAVCVLLMIADHICFDFYEFGYLWQYQLQGTGWFYEAYRSALWYWDWNVRIIARNVVITIFFLTSGISSTFSRSNLARGVKLALVAGLVTAFTVTADHIANLGVTIWFGVLHCFAVCILLTAGLDFLLKKLSKQWPGLVILGALAIGIIAGGWYILAQDPPLYASHNWFMIFGIPARSFTSADYFPLLPWLGVYFAGNILGKTVYRKRVTLLPVLDKPFWKPLKFIGRHALLIYVGHQILIFLIFFLTGMAFGYQSI